MKNKFLLLLASILFVSASFGQNTKRADKSFNSGEYYKAIQEYTLLEDKVTDQAVKSHISYSIAECYRRMNQPEKAESHYVKAIRSGYMSPDVYYGYGEVLLKQGKYDEAQKQFESFQRANPGNKLAEAKIASCVYAKANQMVNPQFKLQPLETINSKGSEYGIAYFNEALIYASTGNPIETDGKNQIDISTRTGLPYSKFYMSIPFNGVYGKGELAVGLNKKDRVNEGTFAYDPVNGLGYYTRCDARSGQCFIYFAEFKNSQWKEKDYLAIESRKMPIGHPFVMPEGNRIYFTSNMEGGYGKTDLWYTDKLPDGSWSKPINLGREVNTAGDEGFPFVAGGYLFFASDGHPGYGGMDIFASKIDGNIHGTAVNLGLPFNSPQDDLNLIEKADFSEGMLVSARRAATNDDIFRFDGFPSSLTVSGSIYDSIGRFPLIGASVEVKKDGKVVEKLTADDSGKYIFYVEPNSEYELSSIVLGYNPNSVTYKSIDERFGKMDNWNLAMQSSAAFISGIITGFERNRDGTIKELGPLAGAKVILYENQKQVKIVEADSKGEYRFGDIKENTMYDVKAVMEGYFLDSKPLSVGQITQSIDFNKGTGYDMDIPLEKIQEVIQLNNIHYDLGKHDLRQEAKDELDKLVALLKKNSHLKVEIRSHTDSKGSISSNDKLSQRRAAAVVDYLVLKGIDRSRLTPKGYGERVLLVKPERSEADYQANRRTEFKVIGSSGESLYDTNMEVSQSVTASQIPVYGSYGQQQYPQQGGYPQQQYQQQPQGGYQQQPQQQLASGGSPQSMPFRIQLSASRNYNLNNPDFVKIKQQFNLDVYAEQGADGIYRYFAGGFNTLDEAKAMANRINSTLRKEYFAKAK